MRKTVTTILSLVLALILVSSLGSGVLLADDDDDDNRKRNRSKYHTVRDVAIIDCLAVTGGKIVVVAFDISGDLPDLIVVNTNDGCAASLALLLKAGFKKHDESTGVDTFVLAKSRYTMVRSRKVKDVADE